MTIKNCFYGLVCSLILLLATTSNVTADTPVSGPIGSDTTWTSAGSPYIVTGNVLVMGGVTLTIEPCVTVKFDSGKALQVDGTLITRGTSGCNITFTSNQPTPAAGDWGYILFTDSSTDATYDPGGNYIGGSILEYVVVEYAGGASVSNNGAVRMDNAHPFVNYATIRNNSASGIMAWNLSGNFNITNSTVSNNTGGGINAYGGTITISNNTISNNMTSGFGGGINACGTINLSISNNTISNNIASGGGWFGGGGILVNCTTLVLFPVVISNNVISNNTLSNGYGGGIMVGSGSNATIFNNTINNNTVSGSWVGNGGGGIGVFLYSNATIFNNTINNNNTGSVFFGGEGGGIYIRSSATIFNNTISNNNAYSSSGGGIYAAESGGGGDLQ